MKKFIILVFTILAFVSCKNEPQSLVRIEGKQLLKKSPQKKTLKLLLNLSKKR